MRSFPRNRGWPWAVFCRAVRALPPIYLFTETKRLVRDECVRRQCNRWPPLPTIFACRLRLCLCCLWEYCKICTSIALVLVLPLRVLFAYYYFVCGVCESPLGGREAVVLGEEGPGMTTTPTSKTARRRRPARLKGRARLCRWPRLRQGLLSQSWSSAPGGERSASRVVGFRLSYHHIIGLCICAVE